MILRRALHLANDTFGAHDRRVPLWLVAAICTACGARMDEGALRPGAATDTASSPPSAAAAVAPPLDPVADSVAQRLVFVPRTQAWFVVLSRSGRLLVDVGRSDIDIAVSDARRQAFHRVVERISPVRIGDALRVRGPWGELETAVGGFDVSNGRLVATVTSASPVDTLARKSTIVIGAAVRADSAGPVAVTRCDTTGISRARVRVVRDSLLERLKTGERPIYARLVKSLKTRTSATLGCFGDGRVIVSATLWGGDYEWVRELVVLLTDAGRVQSLPVRDYRFRAHDLVSAFDADGDGREDVAARGMTTRAGATVVLRLTNAGTLERLAAGFAWER